MKIAVIKPLYKNGDITSMTNYRSVVLLFLHSRLSQHLITNNILVTEQYGFRRRI